MATLKWSLKLRGGLAGLLAVAASTASFGSDAEGIVRIINVKMQEAVKLKFLLTLARERRTLASETLPIFYLMSSHL